MAKLSNAVTVVFRGGGKVVLSPDSDLKIKWRGTEMTEVSWSRDGGVTFLAADEIVAIVREVR